jgi:hypothetical protein
MQEVRALKAEVADLQGVSNSQQWCSKLRLEQPPSMRTAFVWWGRLVRALKCRLR